MKTLKEEISSFLTESIQMEAKTENHFRHVLQEDEEYINRYMGPFLMTIDLGHEDPNRGLLVSINIYYYLWDNDKLTKAISKNTVYNGFVLAEKDMNVILEMTGVADLLEAALSGEPKNVVKLFMQLANVKEEDIDFENIIENARSRMVEEIGKSYALAMNTHTGSALDETEITAAIRGIMTQGLEELDYETLRQYYFEAKEMASEIKGKDIERNLNEEEGEFDEEAASERIISATCDTILKIREEDDWKNASDEDKVSFVSSALDLLKSASEDLISRKDQLTEKDFGGSPKLNSIISGIVKFMFADYLDDEMIGIIRALSILETEAGSDRLRSKFNEVIELALEVSDYMEEKNLIASESFEQFMDIIDDDTVSKEDKVEYFNTYIRYLGELASGNEAWDPSANKVLGIETDEDRINFAHNDSVIVWFNAIRRLANDFGLELDPDEIERTQAIFDRVVGEDEEHCCGCEDCTCGKEEKDIETEVDDITSKLTYIANDPSKSLNEKEDYFNALIEHILHIVNEEEVWDEGLNRVLGIDEVDYEDFIDSGEPEEWFDKITATMESLGLEPNELLQKRIDMWVNGGESLEFEFETLDAAEHVRRIQEAMKQPDKNIEFDFDEISIEALKEEIMNAEDPKDSAEDVKALLAGAIGDESDRVHVLYRKLITKEDFSDELKKSIREMVDSI